MSAPAVDIQRTLVVTTETIPGTETVEVLGRVYGSIAMDADPYAARVRRTSDGRISQAACRELARIREEAVAQMCRTARAMGANAVIGMRFDNRLLGSDCVEICAYGTAVLVRRSRPRTVPAPAAAPIDWARLDQRDAYSPSRYAGP
jgi:uncharacterized protein YbjQ (UPF0145 family)